MAQKVDVLVVGAGVWGSAIARALAVAGRQVVLVDPPPGDAPPRFGGVVWRADPQGLIPGWPRGAPARRQILERKLGLLTPDASLSIDYRDMAWATGPRSPFVLEDPPFSAWLREGAANAGASVWSGRKPTRLLADKNGRVTGVEAEGRTAEALLTVLEHASCRDLATASGVDLGPVPSDGPTAETVVEATFDLPERRVDDRFTAGAGRGFTWEGVLGFLPPGAMAFGYVLPGVSRLAAGTIVHDASVRAAGLTPSKVESMFESHPSVAPFLRDATGRKVSVRPNLTHVPRRQKLYGEGWLRVGDASGLSPTNGLIARGLDVGLRAAEAAVDTALEVVEQHDPTGRTVSRYVARLESEGVFQEVERAQGGGARFKWNPRVHALYPKLFAAAFRRMMTEKGQPKEHLRHLLREVAREAHVPYTGVVRDALGGLANL